MTFTNKVKNIDWTTLEVGFAIFSMFFGAGNIIFPLNVGRLAGSDVAVAIVGLLVTAILFPLGGLIAMILQEGSTERFFGILGKKGGLFLALIIITLLGPLGSTPRCIALAYATLKLNFPDLSLGWFSALSCLGIYYCTMQKKKVLPLLGYLITPLLVLSIIGLLFLGIYHGTNTMEPASIDRPFVLGLLEGYNTMDLMAAFFFSSTVLHLLNFEAKTKSHRSTQENIAIAWRGSFIGGGMLALVYVGFSYAAALHSQELANIEQEVLLPALALSITGSYGSILVASTVALACLSTAIALVTAFTDFIQNEIFGRNEKFYRKILLATLAVTFIVSTYEFTGISQFLGPLLQLLYPGLIMLTAINLVLEWKKRR